MHKINSMKIICWKFIAPMLFAICVLNFANMALAAESSEPLPFDGGKTTWHGFDRYDFIMDEETLVITPFNSPAGEGNSVKDPPKGQRRCIVVVPKVAAPGNP